MSNNKTNKIKINKNIILTTRSLLTETDMKFDVDLTIKRVLRIMYGKTYDSPMNCLMKCLQRYTLYFYVHMHDSMHLVGV